MIREPPFLEEGDDPAPAECRDGEVTDRELAGYQVWKNISNRERDRTSNRFSFYENQFHQWWAIPFSMKRQPTETLGRKALGSVCINVALRKA